MIKQYIKQALLQLRQYPIFSVVSVIGTALAIFLIMIVVMMQQVKTAPFAPESNRDRFLHVHYMSLANKEWGNNSSSNSPMSERTAKELYKSLKTPEAVTIYTAITIASPVSLPGNASTAVDLRETDDAFWQVFDFAFLEGKPYDKATFDAGLPVAVMTESVAQKLFGTSTDVVGKEFLLSHAPYKVAGVVKDVSTLANTCYGQVWVPYTSTGQVQNTWTGGFMGLMSCTLLARSRDDFDAIRQESLKRLEAYNQAIEEAGWHIINRNRPYDQEKESVGSSANLEPDLESERRGKLIVYLILLIVPAINLSSMTHSRLRQRISEIGLRRAFGCNRMELMGQILMENLIVTLLAGAVGLLMSVVLAYWGGQFLFAQSYQNSVVPPIVDTSMLIHASTFGYALMFCFILNLLSTGLPAWMASRINIVTALGGKLH